MGDGFYSQFFLHDISENITMIDIDPKAIKRAKARASKLGFLKKLILIILFQIFWKKT